MFHSPAAEPMEIGLSHTHSNTERRNRLLYCAVLALPVRQNDSNGTRHSSDDGDVDHSFFLLNLPTRDQLLARFRHVWHSLIAAFHLLIPGMQTMSQVMKHYLELWSSNYSITMKFHGHFFIGTEVGQGNQLGDILGHVYFPPSAAG